MIDASVNRTETVLRKISSRDGFQQVVVMQAAETRAGSDAMSGGYAMSGQCGVVRRVIWKSRTQRGMWSFTVVMRNPLHKNRPQMPFVERNHPIETLAPCRSDEAFTMRVRLWRPYRRLQHA